LQDRLQKHNEQLNKCGGKLVETVSHLAEEHFGTARLEVVVFGSVSVGVAIEGSDIDIGVQGLESESPESFKNAICSFEGLLKTQDFVLTTEAIVTARVPVLKLVPPYIHYLDHRHGEVAGQQDVDIAEGRRDLWQHHVSSRRIRLTIHSALHTLAPRTAAPQGDSADDQADIGAE
jgi:hypothetical protein